MVDAGTTDRIVEVLEEGDEPLSVSQIQRRLATRSRDVTTNVIRDACRALCEEGVARETDDLPPKYTLDLEAD